MFIVFLENNFLKINFFFFTFKNSIIPTSKNFKNLLNLVGDLENKFEFKIGK